ncbi:MAG: iron-containing alcohol dehydrogenase [Bacteroidota bacterium]
MENFTAYNPTTLHFGKDVINDLGATISKYGNKVLLVYGKNSIKQNGIYDQVMAQLKKAKCVVYEYSGIRPNPIVDDVDAAASLGRAKEVDVILAIGGGSVIDSAKVISVSVPVYHSAWEFYTGKSKPQTAIPLVAVLTLAATGTEMNPFAVLQNQKTKQKWGWGCPLTYPKHSFLDPSFTLSVPRDYTAYGVADLVAHALEAYFGKGEASLSDRIVYAIIKEAIENGPKLLENLGDYNYRTSIMYAATLALNGITMSGRVSGDWGVHGLGHVLSVLYDLPHGASLTIVFPAWLRVIAERDPERIINLGKNLFNVNTIDDTIASVEAMFKSFECPIRMSQTRMPYEPELLLQTMVKNKANGNNHKLSEEDYQKIIGLIK